MEPQVITESLLGPRDVVVVEGPDALSYLHSQVSQDLRPLAVGGSVWSMVLEPAGKLSGFFRVTRTGDERFELDTDAGFGELLRARIERFKIRVKVDTRLLEAEPGAATRDETERIAAGWPALGHELIPGETLPAGTGLASIAVSFTKGCYPGQELVERMDSRGAEAPRALRRVSVAVGTQVGDPVLVDGEPVGEITSVAGTNAIAWIKRGADAGTPLDFA